MKIILAGYEGSKKILATSSYLLNKYVKDFDIKFLNFGPYDGKLFTGEYISLAFEQIGGGDSWSKYIYNYISKLDDRLIILGVDDHLISEPVDMETYNKLKDLVKGDVKSARLCGCDWCPNDKKIIEDGIITFKQTADYLVTGQYTIWDREALLEILRPVRSVWRFELDGTNEYRGRGWQVIAAVNHPFKYDDTSALSVYRKEVNLNGLNQEDLNYINNNLL